MAGLLFIQSRDLKAIILPLTYLKPGKADLYSPLTAIFSYNPLTEPKYPSTHQYQYQIVGNHSSLILKVASEVDVKVSPSVNDVGLLAVL